MCYKRNERKLLYDDIDKDTSTKGKQVITDKLNMLEKLMIDFLQIDTELNQEDDEVFIAEVLNMDVGSLHDDMDFYNETLDKETPKPPADKKKHIKRGGHAR